MGKSKCGQYEYKIEIPVTVKYSKRDDGSVSIDSISIPPKDHIYIMINKHAKDIKAGAELRI